MIKVIIAGDLCPQERITELCKKGDYQSAFSGIKSEVSNSDISVVNLEAPIAPNGALPIIKSGPNIKTEESVIGAIKYLGFNITTLANNHFYDYGEEGALSTFKTLTKNQIDFVGAGNNLVNAGRILYREINGYTIGFINCCEHEYSIAGNNHAGSNPLNPITLYYSIKEAKEKSDYVIVIIHGGIEHYQLPTQRMVLTYRYAVDCGADVVVNHHQHCFSGYEVYNGRPIFYGLGNFCFDDNTCRNSPWNEGYMVRLLIDSGNTNFELIPYIQCNDEAKVNPIEGESLKMFETKLNHLNSIISDNRMLAKEEECFMEHTRKESDPLHPYTNKYLKALYKRGLLPSFISKKKLLSIQNAIRCESHNDRLLYSLDKRIFELIPKKK